MTHAVKGNDMRGARSTDDRHEAALRLFGSLSGVEEDYLAACEADRGTVVSGMTRFIWKYGKAMAAVLCVAVLGVSYLSFQVGVFPSQKKGFSDGTAGGRSETDGAVPEEAYDSAVQAADTAGQEAAADKRLADEAAAEKKPADETAAGALGPEEESSTADLSTATDGGEQNTVETAKPEALEKEKASQEILSQDKEEGSSGGSEPQVDEAVGCPKDPRREMTLEEAEALAVIGAYLPTAWPADGRISDVRGSDAAGEESVRLTWTYSNQWDSFFVTITNLGTSLPDWVQEAVADVSKPETYDENLYEIPYADTVLDEYHTVFQDPVFRREDFTAECVKARIRPNVGDSGDTSTPRGNFCVLYQTEEGAYVLVHFNGRGSVDEVWSLMLSINYFAQYDPWMKPPAP